MPDFSKRSAATEIMDDLNCSGNVVRQTLLEIEFINKTLGGNAVTLNGIKKLIGKSDKKEFSIADMGCGGGGMLKQIEHWGEKENVHFYLTGIDANQHIIDYAASFWPDESFQWKCEDILQPKQDRYDIIAATLFLHHFNESELNEILSDWYERVNIGIIINDLHRHPLAYYSIKLLTKLFSNSSMVKYDAPLSVLRGFTKKDLESILKKTGIENYTLKWKWAFRYQLIIEKR